jgi:hypothetical protein
MKKKCSICNKLCPLTMFHVVRDGKFGRHSMCKPCKKKYRREWYLKNRKRELKLAKEWRVNFRKWWHDFKSQYKCSKCPENHPACIQFHHPNGDKVADVSTIAWNGKSKTEILKEVTKCIPLCANCHAKTHWEERRKKDDERVSEKVGRKRTPRTVSQVVKPTAALHCSPN